MQTFSDPTTSSTQLLKFKSNNYLHFPNQTATLNSNYTQPILGKTKRIKTVPQQWAFICIFRRSQAPTMECFYVHYQSINSQNTQYNHFLLKCCKWKLQIGFELTDLLAHPGGCTVIFPIDISDACGEDLRLSSPSLPSLQICVVHSWSGSLLWSIQVHLI